MTTITCTCGGTAHHASDTDSLDRGWQCEQCGTTYEAVTINWHDGYTARDETGRTVATLAGGEPINAGTNSHDVASAVLDGYAILVVDHDDSTITAIVEVDKTYQIAFPRERGWDIVETFLASTDAQANAYAEREYPGREWYVLHNGQNINL